MISFAGSADPLETDSSEPMPSFCIRASSRTSILRPTSLAIAWARLAISVGVRIFGGSLARSRVKFIDSPIAVPRAMPSFRSAAFAPSMQMTKRVDRLVVLIFGFVFIELKLAGDDALCSVLGDLDRIAHRSAAAGQNSLHSSAARYVAAVPATIETAGTLYSSRSPMPTSSETGRLNLSFAGEPDESVSPLSPLNSPALISRGQKAAGYAVKILQNAARGFFILEYGDSQRFDVRLGKVSGYALRIFISYLKNSTKNRIRNALISITYLMRSFNC